MWLDVQEEVTNGIGDFFSDIYAPGYCLYISECFNVIPQCITQEMNQALTNTVSEAESKNVVFELGSHKAHGPDGLNGLFFQRNWETIKFDVISLVRNFFQTGSLGDDINHTIVAFIPKVPNPETIGNLRPISCCNFVHRVISKVVVGRLKPIMNGIITPQQSAFVGGRLIQDNLVVHTRLFTI